MESHPMSQMQSIPPSGQGRNLSRVSSSIHARTLTDGSSAPFLPTATPDANNTPPIIEPQKRSLWKNAKAISSLLQIFAIWLAFTIFFIVFIHQVLIEGNVEIGTLMLDAPNTNLIVSFLSQLFVLLAGSCIRMLLAALRQTLAANRGASLPAFFGIGAASGWFSTFWLTFWGWVPSLRRTGGAALSEMFTDGAFLLVVLALPLIGLAFGSVLKIGATFDYYFQASPATYPPVHGGLMMFDNRVLDFVPMGTLCFYFQSWIASLLTNTKYAVLFPTENCVAPRCRSLLLPGSFETARFALDRSLERSLLWGNFFNGSETVRIENAPGTVVVFRELEGRVFDFDRPEDCIYAGESINDTVRVCVRQDGMSVIAGWSACPQTLWENHNCSSTQPWASAPVVWTTHMTAFRQFTSTAYDPQNFSVINVSPIGPPHPVRLNATDYMGVFRALFVPPTHNTLFKNTTEADKLVAGAFQYTLGWAHRTYPESFPDDADSLVKYLHNFLTIPLQWTTTAFQFINYTLPVDMGFAMPPEHLTTVSSGSSRSRMVILPWTGWAFIGAAGGLVLMVAVGLVFIVVQPRPVVHETGVPDLDGVELARHVRVKRTQAGPRTRPGVVSSPPSRAITATSAGSLAAARGEESIPLLELGAQPGIGGADVSTRETASALSYWRVAAQPADLDISAVASLREDLRHNYPV